MVHLDCDIDKGLVSSTILVAEPQIMSVFELAFNSVAILRSVVVFAKAGDPAAPESNLFGMLDPYLGLRRSGVLGLVVLPPSACKPI